MVKKGPQAIALNQRLAVGSKLWSQRGLSQLCALGTPRSGVVRYTGFLENVWQPLAKAGLTYRP